MLFVSLPRKIRNIYGNARNYWFVMFNVNLKILSQNTLCERKEMEGRPYGWGRLWPIRLWPKLVSWSLVPTTNKIFFKKKNKKNKHGAPKGGGPKCGGHRKGRGARRMGGPKFRVFFFPSPAPIFDVFFFLSLSLWVSSRGILVVFSKRRALKCARLEFSGCRVKPPGGPKATHNTQHMGAGERNFGRSGGGGPAERGLASRGLAQGGPGESKPTTTTTTTTTTNTTTTTPTPPEMEGGGQTQKCGFPLPGFGVWAFWVQKIWPKH